MSGERRARVATCDGSSWHPILKGLSNALAVVLFVGLLASSLVLFVLSGGDAAGVPPSFREGRWLFLPGLIVGTLLALREVYLGYERRVHTVVLPDGAATDTRGFFLVLRPFDQNFHVRRSVRHRAPIVDISGGFVRQLVRALNPHGAVLLVGGSKIKGAVMLRPPQHVWKRLVMAAAEDARAVILIPSLSLGVREEI
jgi:hypothetical protein